MPLDALQIMQGYRARDLANQAVQQRMNIVPQELALKQQTLEEAGQRRKALAALQQQQIVQKVQQGRQLAAYQAATLAQRDRQNTNTSAAAAAAAADRKAAAAALDKFRNAQLGQKDRELDKKVSGKVVPSPLQKQLTEAGQLADATDRFAGTFKDEFGGKTITGPLGNVVGRLFGDDTGQSQWWQDYELHQSQVRNKLFGSALTAVEVDSWNKAAVNPRMDPKQIRTNLERRQKLENTALERLTKGSIAGGYNKEQIEAYTGRDSSAKTTAPPIAPPTPAAKGIPPASQRTAGQVYDTPKGKLKWTGTGWVPP